jgi:iodotyrosine deiodinase
MKAELIPLKDFKRLSKDKMMKRSSKFFNEMKKRRTIRNFSSKNISREIIDNCIKAAMTAPSGANMQPWYFVIVTDSKIKKQIRIAAEKEEHEFYTKRATKEWLDALSILATDEQKPFLEKAPFLIAVFAKSYNVLPDGKRVKNYYVQESVGIACGILITALHNAGLASLTHTPSPMNFLNKILNRPLNEKPFMLIVTGYPSKNAKVPKIKKKSFEECVTKV